MGEPMTTRAEVVGSTRRRVPLVLAGLVLVVLAACSSAPLPPPAVIKTATATAPAATALAATAQEPTAASPAPSNIESVPSSAAPAPSTPDSTEPQSSAPGAGPSSVGPVLPASPPTALSMPAIGISSPMIQLGLNPDGSVEVPSLDDPDSKPGWYRNSPAPGTLGPSIILGHVDSREFGPGVFYDLQKLQTGDTVEVAREDGTVAVFSVDSVETVQKSDFPTLKVYGNLDHAGMRLITCGGEFDPDARSYESNIIVYASLTGSRTA
jgi:LPXTG-site transpeptidase (sortase) family protein